MSTSRQTVIPGLNVSRAAAGTKRRKAWEATYTGCNSPCRAMTRRGAARKARRQYEAENDRSARGLGGTRYPRTYPHAVRETDPGSGQFMGSPGG
jgi:hypothetical protein